jgi:hypothetical protein
MGGSCPACHVKFIIINIIILRHGLRVSASIDMFDFIILSPLSQVVFPNTNKLGSCTLALRLPLIPLGVSLTFWTLVKPTCVASRIWCWTKPIACWTWVLNRKFAKSCRKFALIVKRCYGVRRGPKRFRAWHVTFCKIPSSARLARSTLRPISAYVF